MKRLSKSTWIAGLGVFACTAAALAGDGTESAGSGAWAPYAAMATAIIALVFAMYFYKKVMAAPAGNAKMVEIAAYVREAHTRTCFVSTASWRLCFWC